MTIGNILFVLCGISKLYYFQGKAILVFSELETHKECQSSWVKSTLYFLEAMDLNHLVMLYNQYQLGTYAKFGHIFYKP